MMTDDSHVTVSRSTNFDIAGETRTPDEVTCPLTRIPQLGTEARIVFNKAKVLTWLAIHCDGLEDYAISFFGRLD